MPNYIYTSSIDFIDHLEFDYVETFSFQRGEEFEEKKKAQTIEYIELTNRAKTNGGHNRMDEARLTALMADLNNQQKLIIEGGQFHPTSQKINTFSSTDPAVARLIEILQTEIIDVPAWMCAPFYRDAIVFYNRNKQIISALNICLSCEYMQTESFNFVNADVKSYKQLYAFFKDIGHEVEQLSYKV